MKPKQKQILVAAVLIIGAAAALYILKPTGNVELPQTLDPEPEDDMAEALKVIKPEQLIQKEEKADEEVNDINAGEEALPASLQGKIDAKSGFRFEDRYKAHGDDAVVRTSVNGRINLDILKHDIVPQNADFSSAMAVSFYSLKKI